MSMVAKILEWCIFNALITNTAERQQNPSTSSGQVPQQIKGEKQPLFFYVKRYN
jgi:hypothetical protein